MVFWNNYSIECSILSKCLGMGSPYHFEYSKSTGPFSPSTGVKLEYTSFFSTYTSNGLAAPFLTSTGSRLNEKAIS